MRLPQLVVVAALAAATSAPASVPPETAPSITFDVSSDRATVRAEHVPLRQLLAELSTQTGVIITGLTDDVDTPRSIQVADMPLTDLVHRLLSPRPYLIFLGAGEKLDRIAVAGPGRGRIAPTRPTAPEPEEKTEASGRSEKPQREARSIEAPLLETMVTARDPAERMEAVGMLALAENDAERNVALRNALMHDDDANVRAAAFEALEERGPVRTSALLDVALSDPDPDLRLQALHHLAREEIDDEALDGLVHLADSAQDPQIRELAAEIVREAEGEAYDEDFADQPDQLDEPEKTGTS